MSRKENDDFVATKAAKTFDEEGKTVDANVSSNYKGGLLYKGKAKDYPGAAALLKKKSAKIIKIDINKKKNKD
tara:strand:- start:402 stop:620 length:219 start_codon:yes stop_codon:yes gene_type:complete